MEKKEARIKCSGCGTSFKLRIPVTDKPVSFKCKKCGKVLKIKIVTNEEPSPPPEKLEFETSQLPELENYHDTPSPAVNLRPPSVVESHFFAQSVDHPPPSADSKRRWLMLANEMVRGPYNDEEILDMIREGEITAETSLRMGERPWVKAIEISNFRELFPPSQRGLRPPLTDITLFDQEKIPQPSSTAQSFSLDFQKLLGYPVSEGKWQGIAVFAGIAFVLAAILSFDFLIGLPLNLIGWSILFGYLFSLLEQSKTAPTTPPPAWDFKKAKDLILSGAKVLAVFVVYSLVPLTVLVSLMIFFFLNDMALFGYISFVVLVLVYSGTLLIIPAALLELGNSKQLAAALNPVKAVTLIKKSGKPYQAIALVSLAAGLACMIASLVAVFLTEVPVAGFLVAGLVMAAVFSYGHFIWFHVLGRFLNENAKMLVGTPASA